MLLFRSLYVVVGIVITTLDVVDVDVPVAIHVVVVVVDFSS
jgi:hypothetical protein